MKRVRGKSLKVNTLRLELEPFGLTAGVDKGRPVMLFKEKTGESVLPVWLSPVDAGIALTQHKPQACAMSPHGITLEILAKLGVKPETCEFKELVGHQQYAEVRFSGDKNLKSVRARADHAVSFCLHAKVKFYCTRAYLEACREVDADLTRSGLALGNKRPRNTGAYLN